MGTEHAASDAPPSPFRNQGRRRMTHVWLLCCVLICAVALSDGRITGRSRRPLPQGAAAAEAARPPLGRVPVAAFANRHIAARRGAVPEPAARDSAHAVLRKSPGQVARSARDAGRIPGRVDSVRGRQRAGAEDSKQQSVADSHAQPINAGFGRTQRERAQRKESHMPKRPRAQPPHKQANAPALKPMDRQQTARRQEQLWQRAPRRYGQTPLARVHPGQLNVQRSDKHQAAAVNAGKIQNTWNHAPGDQVDQGNRKRMQKTAWRKPYHPRNGDQSPAESVAQSHVDDVAVTTTTTGPSNHGNRARPAPAGRVASYGRTARAMPPTQPAPVTTGKFSAEELEQRDRELAANEELEEAADKEMQDAHAIEFDDRNGKVRYLVERPTTMAAEVAETVAAAGNAPEEFDSRHEMVKHPINMPKPNAHVQEVPQFPLSDRLAIKELDKQAMLKYRSGSQLTLEHPMLLFDSKEVKELQRKSHGSHATILRHMKSAVLNILTNEKKFIPPIGELKFASAWNEHYGNNLILLAFYAALEPDDSNYVNLALKSLRRMAAYSSWKVDTAPGDDVPRAHTLLGVAIAFDILYHYLHEFERQDIPKRIQEELTFLRQRAQQEHAGWNRQYMQNHMLTVQTAILVGALVTEKHAMAVSLELQAMARLHLERVVQLLRHIPDGSLHEGVAYTTYSTRSLFLYFYLAQRHFRLSHFDHPWLQRHFSYLLATTLPDYTGSVGIGDSNPSWFYGPEAQLGFLDKYVLGQGKANWLAARIREARLRRSPNNELPQADAAMLPFEFLWYSAQATASTPELSELTGPRVCSDWGIATFQDSTDRNSTFVSLKSGYILGRGLHRVAADHTNINPVYPYLQGLASFNGGHEHPDQGSFVFYPHGKPFITESFYYKPKFPHMDNTWLFRVESSRALKPSCSGGFLHGQVGACENWLRWQSDDMLKISSDLIMAEADSGMSVMMSESAGAYPDALALKSVGRTVILLNSETLVVVDCIRKIPDSLVLRGSAFFNNLYEPFNLESEDAKVATSSNGQHSIRWLLDMDHPTLASTGTTPSKSLAHKRAGRDKGFYLNVSVPLLADTTHVAWLLTAAGKSGEMEFQTTSELGVVLSVTLENQSPVSISLVTEQSCVSCRYAWHGSGVLAHVKQNNLVIRFGAGAYEPHSKLDLDLRPVKQMVWSTAGNQLVFIYFSITTIGWVLLFFLLFWKFPFFRHPRILWPVAGCAALWMVVLVFFMFTTVVSQLPDTLKVGQLILADGGPPAPFAATGDGAGGTLKPRVLLTGLPSGRLAHAIAEQMFLESPDTVYLPFSDLPISKGSVSTPLSPCLWQGDSADRREHLHSLAQSWLRRVYDQTQRDLKHVIKEHHLQNDTSTLKKALSKLSADPSAVVIGGDMDGAWLLKTSWFLKSIRNGRVLVLVQDPRHWVAGVLARRSLFASGSSATLKEQISDSLSQVGRECELASRCGQVFDPLRQMALSENGRASRSVPKILATVWLAYTRTMLCLAEQNPGVQIVRAEQFTSDPVAAAKDVFRFLMLPFRPATVHHLRTVMHSGLKEYSAVASEMRGSPETPLDSKATRDIVTICADTMDQLGYHPRYALRRT